MKTIGLFHVAIVLLLSFMSSIGISQTPYAFKYQCMVKEGEELLKNHTVKVRLSILKGAGNGVAVYAETHTVTTMPNGMLTLTIGYGSSVSGNLANISWGSDDYYLKVQISTDTDADYEITGTSPIVAVPYALYSEKTSGKAKFTVAEINDVPSDTALFEVKNLAGETVFAVYDNGAALFVNDYDKGGRGGFAVGGRKKTSKGKIEDIMLVTPDSIRFYVGDTTLEKGSRGGFAVGGRTSSKSGMIDYFNISSSTSVENINPSQPRILWYPKKEAFLAGRVIVEHPDSIGTNSTSLGFESKAMGNYSQAFGYQSISKNDYSTALGYKARASGTTSFAFGASAKASGDQSYAIGSVGVDTNGVAFGNPTIASGNKSIAIGQSAQATNTGSMALGYNSIASGLYATALGYYSLAEGNYATALGRNALAGGYQSFASQNGYAQGDYSIALGGARAIGYASFAFGASTNCRFFKDMFGKYLMICDKTQATGSGSVAMGTGVEAKACGSFVIGRYNEISGDSLHWVASDPLFVVGNGSANQLLTLRRNAFTILKNGNVGINTSNPTYLLHIKGNNATDAGIFIQPGKWNSVGDYAQVTLGDDNHYIRGEYGKGLILYDIDGVNMPTVYYDAIASGRALYVSSAGKLGYISSSQRYKDHIESLKVPEWLYRLRPVTFQYKEDTKGELQFGLIAEEVNEVNPLLVIQKEGEPDGIMYERLLIPMLSAIQKQQGEIMTLKEENAELKKTLKRIELLESELSKIRKEMRENN